MATWPIKTREKLPCGRCVLPEQYHDSLQKCLEIIVSMDGGSTIQGYSTKHLKSTMYNTNNEWGFTLSEINDFNSPLLSLMCSSLANICKTYKMCIYNGLLWRVSIFLPEQDLWGLRECLEMIVAMDGRIIVQCNFAKHLKVTQLADYIWSYKM